MKIGLLGNGVVGGGVDIILKENAKAIKDKTGFKIEVSSILSLELSDDERIVDNIDKFLEREMSVVVEAMGGVEPAFTFVKKCILKGLSVVTSNKALICDKGVELFKLAKEKGVGLYYEASVGGVIPIIRVMRENLAQDNMLEIIGILNGTTNFIISQLLPEDGSKPMKLDAAIKKAQELGYAEADPTADVGGFDAARKIAILTSLATNKDVSMEAVETKGIMGISSKDIEYSRLIGYKIKLIARATIGKTTFLEVTPMLVADSNKLSHISGVTNAVCTRTDRAGEILLSGFGAGRFPTASAVVSDVLYAIEHTYKRVDGEYIKAPSHVDYGWSDNKLELTKVEDSISRYVFLVDKDCNIGLKVLRVIDDGNIVISDRITHKEARKLIEDYDIEWYMKAII